MSIAKNNHINELMFDIHDSVKIKDLNVNGRIVSILIDEWRLPHYKVRYFDNKSPLEVYFDHCELESIKDSKEKKEIIGFKIEKKAIK